MPEVAEKVYDEEGFEVDEEGERVVGEDGNPILKAEEPREEEEKKQPGETAEEFKVRIDALERENSGLKFSIGEERRRRRAAEEEATKPKVPTEEEEARNAEYLTRGELKSLKEELKNEVRQENQADQDRLSMELAATTVDNFAEIEKMALEVINTDPDFRAAYESTRDVGKCLIKIAKNHPDYDNRLKRKVREDVVNKIKKGNERVNTVPGGGGSKEGGSDYSELSLEDYSKLSLKQQEAIPEDVKERLLGAV